MLLQLENSSGLISITKRLLKKNPTWRRITVNEVADNDVHVEMDKLDIIKEVSYYITVHHSCIQFKFSPDICDYVVVCDDLKKVYHGKDGNPDKYDVRGLSLALPYGECLGILGPNGAGKSSFLAWFVTLN
ncbi:ABC transporter A family member 7-like [Hordeum vulgare]|nr:ABC transporter A family member 7-like [Hordeum vulgare]